MNHPIKTTEHGELHIGDSLKVMKTLPNACVQAVVTSPPYNIKNSTGNGLKDGRGGKWKNAALQNAYDTYDDNMPHELYVEWQRECLKEMMRLIPDDGVIFYNHKWRVQKGLLQTREDIMEGFPVRQIIIWQRAGGFNFNPGYFVPTYEVIYMIAKPKFKLAPKTNGMGDIWTIPQERNNEHPAPFPVELARRCCEAVGRGKIMDPFIGSGTTAIAAEMQKLKWLGIELSETYANMAIERINESNKSLEDDPIVF